MSILNTFCKQAKELQGCDMIRIKPENALLIAKEIEALYSQIEDLKHSKFLIEQNAFKFKQDLDNSNAEIKRLKYNIGALNCEKAKLVRLSYEPEILKDYKPFKAVA